jgi:Protein of unknown function (DUF1570)
MLPLIVVVALAQPPAPWPLDELKLANGAVLHGLILEDTAAGVRFQVVRRPPGRPTVTLTTYLLRAEVAGVKKVSDADRAAVAEKLADLDPRGSTERRRMEALELKPADWLGTPAAARRYESDYFTLVSPAADEVTRRAAVRLEQIFTAYSRFLPPRTAAGRPTLVALAMDRGEYAKLLGPAAGPVVNPAAFDPAANRIVCLTDLRKLGGDLTAARAYNLGQFAALDKYEADVRGLYKRPELDRHLETVARERKRVRAAEAANDAKFDAATLRPLARLYHETFHAYAGNFVYPPGGPAGELPRWLNEGLAQIFETAVLEAGELRVGHADPDRLRRAQEAVKGGTLVPVADLLKAGRETFLAAHADQAAAADRAYLTAWAVAFQLTFDAHLLGGPAFDRYLKEATAGDPAAAFARLVGAGPGEYQRRLHEYLTKLNPDGTVRK